MEIQENNTGNNNVDISKINALIEKESGFIDLLNMEIGKVIIGQKHMVESLLIGLLSNGHILLEGVPGLAKTLAISTLSKVINVDFKRIQFTPDLLPADLIGTEVFRPKDGLVMATQNPIEQEGTYPLPEAQVDRFMLKVVLPYPNREEEKLIVRANVSSEGFPTPKKVVDPKQIIKARDIVKKIYMDEKIEKYIIDIVYATRDPEYYQLEEIKHFISFGGSPRASISLASAAKAYAFLKKRGYVIPEDVRAVCSDVLRHRIGLSYEAEAENITTENVITTILNKVEVP